MKGGDGFEEEHAHLIAIADAPKQSPDGSKHEGLAILEADHRNLITPTPNHDFFRSLQWTSDGTTLPLPSSSSQRLHTYILPPDLLTPPPSGQHTLSPYTTHAFPEPAYAFAIHPRFALSNPTSCLYLVSPRSLPIRLISPFAPGILASYPLVTTHLERWDTPNSLLFHPRDQVFYAGKSDEVCLFDLQRDGEAPFARLAIGRRRRKNKGHWERQGNWYGELDPGSASGGLMHGIVSAMAMNTEGVLAVGTFAREAGIVDTNIEDALVNKLPMPAGAGTGVTEVKFHPEPSRGNYLVVASRMSRVLLAFDTRNTKGLLARMVGREAVTQQRLGIEVAEDGQVWAGGTDGVISVWEGLGMKEGEVQPVRILKAHDDAIGGIGLHPGGARLLATCAGSWRPDGFAGSNGSTEARRDKDEGSESRSASSSSFISTKASTGKAIDHGLKVWTI